ncbi:hypothetical protein [Pontixanthobacter sp.]|uniref:hypothetical protein n=1 Tax=Pontixanthobacter sp. TaxID=2792078 RepID=UPI003C7E4267
MMIAAFRQKARGLGSVLDLSQVKCGAAKRHDLIENGCKLRAIAQLEIRKRLPAGYYYSAAKL